MNPAEERMKAAFREFRADVKAPDSVLSGALAKLQRDGTAARRPIPLFLHVAAGFLGFLGWFLALRSPAEGESVDRVGTTAEPGHRVAELIRGDWRVAEDVPLEWARTHERQLLAHLDSTAEGRR